jgi:hypothetical protein
MAVSRSNYHAWIFVSHASDDLVQVRKVRNYLEEKGASPLLFHLLALKEPEEFWPIIAKEIEARNFFLYCESEIAQTREWVRRERAAVDTAAKLKPVRIGAIRVDGPELDLEVLDTFLAKIRVFPSYSGADSEHVQPYLDALKEAGFQVFEERNLAAGVDWRNEIENEMKLAALDGWIVAFLSPSSLESDWAQSELSMARILGGKFIAVAIANVIPHDLSAIGLSDIHIFDGTRDPTGTPKRLVAEMLRRRA